MKKAKFFGIIVLTIVFVLSLSLFTACKLPNNKKDSDTDSVSITDTDTGSESITDTGSDSTTDTDSDSTTDSDSESVSESDSESTTDSDSDDPLPPTPSYYYPSGSFAVNNNGVTSLEGNSIAVSNEQTFSTGTLYTTVKLAGVAGDNGIIFGLTNTTGSKTFWEGNGISYYFFFISQIGQGYLGKTTNGQWKYISAVAIPGFSASATYTLAVSWDRKDTGYDVINCYVNDVLYVPYKETETKLRGNEFGMRAGNPNVTYSDIRITDEILGNQEDLTDYTVAHGAFEMTEEGLKSTAGNAIAVRNDGKFVNGTLEATMKLSGTPTDNGIIFSLTGNSTNIFWEAGVSYYFFFTNKDNLAFLGKVDNGVWSACQAVTIPNFSQSGTYNLKVERINEDIMCYINGVKYIDYTDGDPLTGTGYGFRAGATDVVYSNLVCNSTDDEFVETIPDNLEVVTGKLTGTNQIAKAAQDNTVALLKDVQFTSGTYTAQVKAMNPVRAGLIFAYSENSYYRFNTVAGAGSRVELVKVDGANSTILYSNYLSAGFNQGNAYPFKVIINNGKAYCYFWNTLYTVIDVELQGTGAGIYAEKAGSRFIDLAVNDDATIPTVNTLLFGHSYFEMWDDWKTDLAAYTDIFGTYNNVGIGGSVASHWTLFEAGIVAYQPKIGIYNIGVNDITGGTSPEYVAKQVKTLLLSLKQKLGDEFKVVLLGCAYCPARETIRPAIEQTNVLYRNLAASYDWIYFAEQQTVFCDNGTTPDNYWFKDGLHPTAAGYREKVLPAILSALRGENQPTLSQEDKDALLAEAKETKSCLLTNYTVDSFRANEWLTAQPIYAQAVQAINECATIDQVDALDLSEYISQLDVIKNNADYVYETITAGTTAKDYEDATFTATLNASADGKYSLASFGHRIDTTYMYTDSTFTFRLSDVINGSTQNGKGLLFRVTDSTYRGINGYLINYVTDNNYIQVWYCNNAYATSGNQVLEYIGGWVFPEMVENTLFRAVVEGGYVYIYKESDYTTFGKKSYGCSVDLTGGGRFAIWNEGGMGVLLWEANGSCKIEISNISAAECHPSAEEEALKALLQAKEQKKAQLANYDASAYKPADYEAITSIINDAYAAINACTTAEEVNELELTPWTDRISAYKNLASYAFDNLSTGNNCLSYEVPAFTNAINSSTDGVYNISGDGHRLDASTEFTDVSVTFSATTVAADGFLRYTGVLLRAHQNQWLGIDGYMVNVMTKDDNGNPVNYLQVFEMKNGYNNNTWAYCEYNYIGGWVYPGNVNGMKFTVDIKGTDLKVYDETGTCGVTVDLTGGGTRTPYTQGYVGVVSWSGASDNKMTLTNLRGTIVENTEAAPKAIAALKENTDCHSFNGGAITANEDGSFRSSGFAYRLYNQPLADSFSMKVKVSNTSGDTATAGFLFRARKSALGDGIDGYFLNFVSNSTNNFVQVIYMQNCCNTAGTPAVFEYLGGINLDGTGASSINNEISIYVESNFILMSDSLGNVSQCFLFDSNRTPGPYTSGGSFGVLTWQDGYSADLSILSITPY